MLKCLFKKVAGLRPAALAKIDSSTGAFREFCEIFENIYFVYDYRALHEISVLKNLA